MTFLNAQSRLNRSVLKHLSNASVKIDGIDHLAIFKRPFQVIHVGLGVADSRPSITVDASIVPNAPEGVPLSIDGVSYVVAEPQPGDTGMTVLFLEYA